MDEIEAKKYVMATIKIGSPQRIKQVIDRFREKYRNSLHQEKTPPTSNVVNLAKEIFGITT